MVGVGSERAQTLLAPAGNRGRASAPRPWSIMGTVDSVDKSETTTHGSRKIQVLGAIQVAVGSFVIAAIHVGLAPAFGIVIATPLIVIALISALLRHDQNRRKVHLPDGVLASAGASARVHQLRKFDPTMQLRGGPGGAVRGRCRGNDGLARVATAPRFRGRGATDVVVPWADVREMNCHRLGGLFRYDACHLTLHDGRNLTISITGPIEVERTAASLGDKVTGATVESLSSQ